MIDAAEPVLRPLKMRSAGRDLARTDPDPFWEEEGPDPRVEPVVVWSSVVVFLGKGWTAVLSLTAFFLEDIRWTSSE
jgi:hypothetical protein